MPDIKGRLNEIDKEIRDLESTAKAAKTEVRDLGTALQFDPTNVDTIRERFSQMRIQLDANRKTLDKYNQRLAEIRKAQQGMTDTEGLRKLDAEAEKTERRIDSLSRSIEYLTLQTDQMREKTTLATAAQSNMNKRMAEFEQIAQKTARVALLVVTAYAALVTKTVESGNEIYATAKKYNTTAESLQTYNKQLEIATGETDVYTNSLKTMSKGMADIASGRGIAYEQALRNIGIRTKEWTQLSTAKQFQAIFEGLSKVTDATQRNAAAQKLLGDSGLYVAQAASLSAEAWADVTEESNNIKKLTDEQVEALHDLNTEFVRIKAELGATFADLVVKSVPIIEAFVNFLNDVAVPVLNAIGNILKSKIGSVLVPFLTVTLIALPKIIALIKAIKLLNIAKGISTATAAFAGLNVVTAKWQLILTAVAIVVISIIALINRLTNKANEAQTSLNGLVDSYGSLNGAGVDVQNSTENYTSYQSEKTVNIGVEVKGSGDTAVSDATASQIATLTAEEVNKALGDLIK
nr:MAG TPA: tail tape measure [Caudoviricetes sp.]